jgi:hypothetical protein
MYIHDSLLTDEFKSNKKLNLLKTGVITPAQFINLIELTDPYMIVGPAIVAKDKVDDFIKEWNNSEKHISEVTINEFQKITVDDIIAKLNEWIVFFPEINDTVVEFNEHLNRPITCPLCLKNKYIINILATIKKLLPEKTNISNNDLAFINQALTTYFPQHNKIVNQETLNDFDINWIKPDKLVGIGNDLIDGLINCFDCCKKHLSRAKILCEEWLQNYPEHGTLMFNEFTEANKVLEEAYSYYWDSLGQLDMASTELIGTINSINLNTSWAIEMINLANELRKARILFQEDTNNIPNWNQLRVDVQKLQNKINKFKQN